MVLPGIGSESGHAGRVEPGNSSEFRAQRVPAQRLLNQCLHPEWMSRFRMRGQCLHRFLLHRIGLHEQLVRRILLRRQRLPGLRLREQYLSGGM